MVLCQASAEWVALPTWDDKLGHRRSRRLTNHVAARYSTSVKMWSPTASQRWPARIPSRMEMLEACCKRVVVGQIGKFAFGVPLLAGSLAADASSTSQRLRYLYIRATWAGAAGACEHRTMPHSSFHDCPLSPSTGILTANDEGRSSIRDVKFWKYAVAVCERPQEVAVVSRHLNGSLNALCHWLRQIIIIGIFTPSAGGGGVKVCMSGWTLRSSNFFQVTGERQSRSCVTCISGSCSWRSMRGAGV